MTLRHSSASATDGRQQSAMEVVDPALAGRSRGPGAGASFSTGISTDSEDHCS
jgi:hypothetical protein